MKRLLQWLRRRGGTWPTARPKPLLTVNLIPHSRQRYDTCGDWLFLPNGTLQVLVCRMSDPDCEHGVALHEIVEALLCQKHGITDEEVCEHDIMFEEERARGLHSETAEPGDDPRAPYRREHDVATEIERIFIEALGLSWPEYERSAQANISA